MSIIPAFFKLSSETKSLAVSSCRINQCLPKKQTVFGTIPNSKTVCRLFSCDTHYPGSDVLSYCGQENAMEAEINALCHENLPEYSCPFSYCFPKALPLTAVGKVDWRKLEEEGNY